MASAASDAVNFVVAPISRALSRKASKSSPAAPDIAATFDIEASKSAVVLMMPAPIPAAAADKGMSACPAPLILSPTFLRLSPASDIFCMADDAEFASFSSALSSFVQLIISLERASYCS